jgi:hypothetical protein
MGITLEDDAYDICIGDEHRDIVKQTFITMVQMKQPSNTPPRDIDFKSTGRTWKQIRDLILKKHEPIKDSFFKREGNKLQFRDSQLAEQIILHFAKRDIPILPVHDCFIITRGLYSELVYVMHNEFEKMFNVPIKIDDRTKVIPISFPKEAVDVEWIISESDRY